MTRILGIDVGIASIGFALVDMEKHEIVKCGVHLFDRAENPKDGKPLAEPRRTARGQRRRLRRRRWRLDEIHRMLIEHGFKNIQNLLERLSVELPEKSPWDLRAEGLERLLTDEEFARVLLHIAKRRGFQSNRRINTGEDADGKKMLAGMAELEKQMAESEKETVGAYLAFLDKKRNEPDKYNHTVLRDLLRAEVVLLFERQRSFNNELASEKLCEDYSKIAFTQRPLQASIGLVGFCEFEREEKRAPRASRFGELFIAYSRLANLRIILPQGGERRLSAEEMAVLIEEAQGLKSGVTFNKVKKMLELDDACAFNLANYRNTSKKKMTPEELKKEAENKILISLPAWHELKNALGEKSADWDVLSRDAVAMNQVAVALTFFEDEKDVRPMLESLHLSPGAVAALMNVKFKGTVNLSLKALGNILPHMTDGLMYSDACVKAGYHHSKKAGRGLDKLPPFEPTRNPVTDRALAQSRKVINAVIREYGMPDRFHVELARELGKSKRLRDTIKKENDIRADDNKERKLLAAEVLGRTPTGEDSLKFRLWMEQRCHCLYSGVYINPFHLRDSTAVQIDHALPKARSWDNSLSNKVLCFTDENQRKGARTPYEYLEPMGKWEEFLARAGKLPTARRRKVTIMNFDEKVAQDWKSRNLNDTGYIARLLKKHIEEYLGREGDDKQFVYARNGAVTSMLRGMWGLNKDRDSNCLHHAMDAIVLACATQSMVQKVNEWNRYSPNIKLRKFDDPWDSFRGDIKVAINSVFVSRQPVRKMTGEAHQATIKTRRTLANGREEIIKRVKLTDLNDKNLQKLVEVDVANGKVSGRNKFLYDLLKRRLDAFEGKAKKAFAEPIYMPSKKQGVKGPVIRNVRIRTDDRSCITIPGRNGVANNGDVVRTDVFRKKGNYYIIPVYVHQIASGRIPNRICKAKKKEEEWPLLDESFDFMFRLQKNDFVKIEKPNKQVFEGYFIKPHRAHASIILRPHDASDEKQDVEISVKSLLTFKKFTVSLLGEKFNVKGEKRIGLADGVASKRDEVEA